MESEPSKPPLWRKLLRVVVTKLSVLVVRGPRVRSPSS